jgi:hypothetical protein
MGEGTWTSMPDAGMTVRFRMPNASVIPLIPAAPISDRLGL